MSYIPLVIMFLCQHLGEASEEGAYTRDKCQILHISPPHAKVSKQGVYMQDTTVNIPTGTVVNT